MTKDSSNIYAPSTYSVWTAPFGTALPTSATANPGAAWYEVGTLSDQGIGETRNINETKIYDLVGQLQLIIRNQEERPITFQALEDNVVVRGLRYPGTSTSTAGGTAEVQTLTITATGGTYSLSGGYGSSGTASAIAYNATNSAIQTAVRTLPGFSTATVTGTGPFVITFATAEGNVAQLTVDTSLLTGGTATLATTTPGVAPTTTRNVGSGTGQNRRAWYLYTSNGLKTQAIAMASGEAVQSGTVQLSGSAPKISEFTLNPYPDSNGNFFILLDQDPAQSAAFA